MIKKPHLCQIPEYDISCAGCCGIGVYDSREELIEAIRKNTTEYRALMVMNPAIEQKEGFFNRGANIDRDSGLCSPLIYLDEIETRVGCAAHPNIHDVDYRIKFNLCYTPYECKQSKEFSNLSESKRKLIIQRLQNEYKSDWIRLSIDMEEERIKL